ncbi:MAG: helix-turn-helix transcriptional regulator [Clostridia bacterium]|nr:helix-turn-helix transcriptional regulator [Clostridia bacterium]
MRRDKIIARRLRQLRLAKGVSQNKMSTDLHLAESYIYNIEAGYAYPSMTHFFAICEYLDILPYEFMKFEPGVTSKEDELLDAVQGLTYPEIDKLIAIAKEIQQTKTD